MTPEPDHSGSDYRRSHASQDYGRHYSETYRVGYYAELWDKVERPLLESVLRDLVSGGARSCLDFACGTGRITAVAEKFFQDCVGVDVSAAMLEIARTNCRSAELVQADTTKEPLARRFDVVTSFRFFLNAEPSLRRDALAAMQNMLAPGGRMVFNVHVTPWSPTGIAYRLRNALRGRAVANTLGFRDFEALLRAGGVRIDVVHWYGFLPRTGGFYPPVASRLMLPLEKLASRLPLIPRGVAQAFLVVCSRTG